MKRFTVILLCLFMGSIIFAQDGSKGISEKLGLKNIFNRSEPDLDPFAGVQVAQGDKPRIMMLSSYVTNAEGEISQCLELASTDFITFWIDFTSLWKTDVKFHFIWTGPEFYYHETEWYDARANEYYYLALDTNTNWRKGIYKLIIIAEQGEKASGASAVIETVMQFY